MWPLTQDGCQMSLSIEKRPWPCCSRRRITPISPKSRLMLPVTTKCDLWPKMAAQDGRQLKNDLDHVIRSVDLPLLTSNLAKFLKDVAGYGKIWHFIQDGCPRWPAIEQLPWPCYSQGRVTPNGLESYQIPPVLSAGYKTCTHGHPPHGEFYYIR